MRAVAERFVGGKATAAETDHRASPQTKCRARRVADLEVALVSLAPTLQNKTVTVTIDRNQCQEAFGPVILAVSRAGLEIALAGQEDNRRGR